jgi:hypothetical protein
MYCRSRMRNGEDLALIADRVQADTTLIGLDAWSAQLDKARSRLRHDPRISLREHRWSMALWLWRMR